MTLAAGLGGLIAAAPAPSGDFDVVDPEKIRMLVEMMSEHDLLEITLRDGEEEIHLKRPGASGSCEGMVGGGGQMIYSPQMPMMPPAGYPAAAPGVPVASGAEAGPLADGGVDEDAGLITVNSPMVGTFYESPNPESPAFVTVGSKVSLNTVVCIVEAMKVFNEIKAEVSGTIAKVLIKNESAVEFGQPMFLVTPE